jgi:hypothetical protein
MGHELIYYLEDTVCEATMDPVPQAPEIQNRHKKVPFFLHIALLFLLICINALVAKFVVFSFAMGPGISSLYVVVALMIAFTLWFGIYGAVAAYAGCSVGAGILSGLPLDVSLYWSLADLWQVLIPLFAFRYFTCDPALKSRRDWAVLIVFGVFINNITGSAWGVVTLALGNEIAWAEVLPVFSGWLAGNVIVCLVVLPLLLWFLTPVIREHELYIRHYWD